MENSGDDMDAAKLLDARERLKDMVAEAKAVNKAFVDSINATMAGALEMYKNLHDLLERVELCQPNEVEKVTSKDGNPYIVVFVDASALIRISNASDIRANGNGGRAVAQRLKVELQQYVRSAPEIPQDIHVLVRFYADLKDVSLAAIRAKLVDPNSQPRALAPFVSAFNEIDPWFDFVDCGSRRFTKVKVSENFQMFAQDPNCKRLIFGVGPVAIYVDMIAQHQGKNEKVVFLRVGQVASEYEDLDLEVIDFPGVFTSSQVTKPALPPAPVPLVALDRARILRRSDREGSTLDSGSASKNSYSTRSLLKDSANGDDRYVLPDGLPLLANAPHGLIPVNRHLERLDFFLRTPSQRDKAIFYSQAARTKPCNAHYLEGNCSKVNCPFSHTALSNADLNCFRRQLKAIPCDKGSRCRKLICIYGHICQDCMGNKKYGCKMPSWAHSKDLKVYQWVTPKEASVCEDTIDVDKVSEPQDEGSLGVSELCPAPGSGDTVADLLGLDDDETPR